jgi:hypothetical protein
MLNLKTDIKFVVHSDLNDELVYAEFDSKKAAIRYARDYSNEFTYVDKVECFLDPETGRIDEIISSVTVWNYLDESVDPENVIPEDEDYWDMMVANYEEEEANKHDLGDTNWFESMDNLVETLEESEDTVECKECFELFPKVDCIKLDVGYVCPTCAHCEVADEDTFKIEFPEYEKFRDTGDAFDDSKLAMSDEDVARVNEPFEEPFNSDNSGETEGEPELTAEEAVPFLVNDEVEAVAGYEQAAEVVADSDLENKEEILDTIDHIKEEEEEHIEELQDLVDDEIVEVENETTSEVAKEDEVEEIEDPEPVVEHVNKECAPIESDQKLEGTDNAVVDCKVADVITHSEDEKPVDCEGKKKPLEKPLTEGFMFSLNNEKDLAEFTKLCKEVGMKTIGDLDRFVKETAEDKGTILDKLRAYRDELGADFKLKESATKLQEDAFCVAEYLGYYIYKDTTGSKPYWCQRGYTDQCWDMSFASLAEIKDYIKKHKNDYLDEEDDDDYYYFESVKDGSQLKEAFTKEEQEEYNMDEDGNSLDSYDRYVRCTWCDEIFTEDQCVFEADMGWLCDRCYEAILSRGEKLTIIKNPTEEDEARVLTEDVEDENELISTNPEEKLPKNLKMANTASTSGMDFEAACKKFGIELED